MGRSGSRRREAWGRTHSLTDSPGGHPAGRSPRVEDPKVLTDHLFHTPMWEKGFFAMSKTATCPRAWADHFSTHRRGRVPKPPTPAPSRQWTSSPSPAEPTTAPRSQPAVGKTALPPAPRSSSALSPLGCPHRRQSRLWPPPKPGAGSQHGLLVQSTVFEGHKQLRSSGRLAYFCF